HESSGTAAGNPDWYRGTAFVWESVLADPTFAAIHPRAAARAAEAYRSAAKSVLRRGGPDADAAAAAFGCGAWHPSLQARLIAAVPGVARAALALRDAVLSRRN